MTEAQTWTAAEGFDLSAANTLGLASRAQYGAELHSAADLRAAAAFAAQEGLPFHVLGGGSNCVLAPRVRGVVGIMRLAGRRIDRTDPEVIRVTAAAGESWPDLVDWTVAEGVAGLENLAGIPGTVGAAPIQNIGAYGVELSDVFERLSALDLTTGETVGFGRDDCRFAYRQSRFKAEPGRYVVLEVTLALPLGRAPVLSYAGLDHLPPDASAETIRQAVLAQRAAKLPDWRETGNAGSFFHNPIVPEALAAALPEMPKRPSEGGVKLSAGWLLDAAGMKGFRHGGAGFSPRHALVLVNTGGATFDDVAELTRIAQEAVQDRFGVELVREPVLLD